MPVFIFSATLRDNLDPLKSHNDAKLWDSLKKARLSDVVKNKLAPLDPYVGGRGLDAMIDHETTFSAGEMTLQFVSYWKGINALKSRINMDKNVILSIFRATSIVMSCTCHSFIGNYCLC